MICVGKLRERKKFINYSLCNSATASQVDLQVLSLFHPITLPPKGQDITQSLKSLAGFTTVLTANLFTCGFCLPGTTESIK